METKIFNPLRTGYRIILKIMCVWPPHTYLLSVHCLDILLMRRWMISWGVSSQTWIRALVGSRTVCDVIWRILMAWYESSMTGDKVINTFMMYILYSSDAEREWWYDMRSLRNLKIMCFIHNISRTCVLVCLFFPFPQGRGRLRSSV